MAEVIFESQYRMLWRLIKEAPYNKPVIVETSRAHRETLIQAIAKIKTAENTARKMAGLPSFGVMQVERIDEPDSLMCKVKFSLPRNVEKLI